MTENEEFERTKWGIKVFLIFIFAIGILITVATVVDRVYAHYENMEKIKAGLSEKKTWNNQSYWVKENETKKD